MPTKPSASPWAEANIHRNNHDFINALRALHNIDRHHIPEVTDWVLFWNNPARYLIRCDDIQATAIMREVRKAVEAKPG